MSCEPKVIYLFDLGTKFNDKFFLHIIVKLNAHNACVHEGISFRIEVSSWAFFLRDQSKTCSVVFSILLTPFLIMFAKT